MKRIAVASGRLGFWFLALAAGALPVVSKAGAPLQAEIVPGLRARITGPLAAEFHPMTGMPAGTWVLTNQRPGLEVRTFALDYQGVAASQFDAAALAVIREKDGQVEKSGELPFRGGRVRFKQGWVGLQRVLIAALPVGDGATVMLLDYALANQRGGESPEVGAAKVLSSLELTVDPRVFKPRHVDLVPGPSPKQESINNAFWKIVRINAWVIAGFLAILGLVGGGQWLASRLRSNPRKLAG